MLAQNWGKQFLRCHIFLQTKSSDLNNIMKLSLYSKNSVMARFTNCHLKMFNNQSLILPPWPYLSALFCTVHYIERSVMFLFLTQRPQICVSYDANASMLYFVNNTTTEKFRVFCDVAPCSLIGVDRRFRGAHYLHHQGNLYVFQQDFVIELRNSNKSTSIVDTILYSV
jgi:hypothetical protein